MSIDYLLQQVIFMLHVLMGACFCAGVYLLVDWFRKL